MINQTLKLIILIGLSFMSFLSFSQQPVLNFDGVNDRVDLGNTVGNGLRTIEMWFMPNLPIDATTGSLQTLIAREVSGQNTNEFNISFIGTGGNAGRLRFNIDELGVGNNVNVLSNNNSWNACQWYHLAAVIDPVNGLTMFIDGVQQTDIDNAHTTVTATDPNNPTILGHWGDNYALNRFFNGRIDDVRISSNAVYNANFTPPCPDITTTPTTLGLWNINEGTGATIGDNSGNGNPGTIDGATWTTAIVCDSVTCVCNTEFALANNGNTSSGGIQSTNLAINTNGIAVTSICINIPYFRSLVDEDCIQCEPGRVQTYGTFLAAQAIGGVPGMIDDPYGNGSGRTVCYTFATPTIINTSVQLDLQFPPTLELECCENRVDYCFDVTVNTGPCTSCEYLVCLQDGNFEESKAAIKNDENALEVLPIIEEPNVFMLSPNPTKTNIQMNVIDHAFRSGNVQFISSEGQVVLEESIQDRNSKFNLSDFTSGSYFVTLTYNGISSTKLLVIQ